MCEVTGADWVCFTSSQLAQCSGDDDAAAILPREVGSSSYLFTTKLTSEASAPSDTSIDTSAWPHDDMEAGLSLRTAGSDASLTALPLAGLLPRRRSGGKPQLSAELELAPR